MKQEMEVHNDSTDDGRPDGGSVDAIGLHIEWQRGALREPDGETHEPNGAFVETVIAAAKQRIEYYQSSEFACEENERAIHHLGLALEACGDRQRAREARGVAGTHAV